ncbi:MAG: hypothetical protein H6817_02705 [Phycisphaerales bacterium]|nr:hypothetical protein [Phycisphaerales bacterium]
MTIRVAIISLVCATGVVLSLHATAGAYLYLRVIWPASEAIADAWYARPFDPELWQELRYTGSIPRGRHPRADMLDDLLKRQPLIGMSAQDIEALLGSPDRRGLYEDTNTAYFLGPERGFIRMGDAAWLVLRFDESSQVERLEVVGIN